MEVLFISLPENTVSFQMTDDHDDTPATNCYI